MTAATNSPGHLPAAVRIIAFLWGLQFSFLTPALALVLVSVFGASTGQVAGVLVIYNGACLGTAWVIPRWADRHNDYLRPMLGCAVFTVALAIALLFAHSLLIAVAGLVLLGAPAVVGTPLLFGFMRHSGAAPRDLVKARAMFSAAWVAGPPLASVIISTAGGRTIVLAIGAVGALNIVAIGYLVRQHVALSQPAAGRTDIPRQEHSLVARSTVVLVVGAFALLQAAASTAVSITTLFVKTDLGLSPLWGGAALGVAAGLEVPTLFFLGRKNRRMSDTAVLSVACLIGIGYYLTISTASNGAVVIAAQLLNAAFYGVVAGVGITLFQSIIAGPGAAAGLLSNSQRAGALLAGPMLGIGSVFPGGLRAVFVACSVATGISLVLVRIVHRRLSADGARSVGVAR